MGTWLLLSALLTATPAQDPDTEWAVATSRMLGAAGTVRDRAWNLGQTAQAAAATGRASAISALASDAAELNRAVVSATLAAESLEKSAR